MSSADAAPAAPLAWTPPPGWVPTPQGWVPPEALAPVFAPSEPVPFHRLFRTLPRYRWWRPLVAVLLAAVYYLVLSIAVSLVLFAIGVATGDIRIGSVGEALTDVSALAQIDAASPFSITFALTSIAIMLPAVQLALLTIGVRPTSVRHSVAFRLRWRWLLISLGPASVVLALNLAIGFLVPGLISGEWPAPPATELGQFLLCGAIILVLTPFQAAAEEYVFRGLLPQAIGSWVRFFPVGAVVSTLGFAALHAYDFWGLVDVFLFGFAASLVVWRTGGLEAGIAYHSVNNIASFLLLASGVFGTTVNESQTAGPIGPAISLVTLALWVFWMSWLARRVARLGAYAPPAPALAAPPVVSGSGVNPPPVDLDA
ncbi:MAG TPA: type II CAAX endopeptidase family protein [Pseudolysinimonas sp.]|nr:type II CAAX endopeptidase family protein [Pseudolysinimonas sp.]